MTEGDTKKRFPMKRILSMAWQFLARDPMNLFYPIWHWKYFLSGIYLFNGNKIITTGGGGMIVTDNAEYAERVRYLSTQAKDDPVRYIHSETGYNYRLTNIQAAIGVAQLERLPVYIEKKKSNFARYKEAISDIDGLHLAEVPDYADQNHWFYSLQIDRDRYGRDREGLMENLASNSIQTRPVWELNHRQKMYRDDAIYDIENAMRLWEITLNIPCSVNLGADEIDRVIEVLEGG